MRKRDRPIPDPASTDPVRRMVFPVTAKLFPVNFLGNFFPKPIENWAF